MNGPKTIFLSYRFTGENINELTETLGRILSALRSVGHTVYCSIEDEKWFRENHRINKEILKHALEQLDKSDVILAFVKSDQKSEGMLLEIGYMMARGKSFSLALKQEIKTTFLAELAEPLVEFDSVGDLCNKLKKAHF
ncbi:nucleoside 2-deoxyribosyltransferase [Candidatus Azambacteria bacterium]|nr:nucleoside 2-deoxyribosyltransferase [Candidatus Azambacteria bacterium]MBI3684994.1 nucleoside 2-deoxyribosyltransferase [Candidatus Azambacteria bacterium]